MAQPPQTNPGPAATGRSAAGTRVQVLKGHNETIRALQAALAATAMEPDEGPDHYIMQAKRLRSGLTAVKAPVTERHLKDIWSKGSRTSTGALS